MAEENVSIDPELEAMLSGGGEGGESPEASTHSEQEAQNKAVAASRSQLTESEGVNLEFLLDVKLKVTFEVGRSKMLISDLLTLGQGSVIELHRMVGENLDLLVNGKLVAKGDVVVSNEKFSCRISEVVPPEQRIKHMGTYQ